MFSNDIFEILLKDFSFSMAFQFISMRKIDLIYEEIE